VSRYESSVDAEVQQRAVEFLALSRKGLAMVDIMAEMPKFPERQVCTSLGVIHELRCSYILGLVLAWHHVSEHEILIEPAVQSYLG